MSPHDLRDIKLYGTISVVCGFVQLLMSGLGITLILATGGSQFPLDFAEGAILSGTLLIMSSAIIGLGGEFQRASRASALARENLRLTWTAQLLVLVVSFLIGLWLLPMLASVAAIMILGLVWIRQPVIRVTSL